MKVAVVGSGIAGLAAAHALRQRAAVSLFEANDYFGGHTHTVDVCLPDRDGRPLCYGVDTGFLVFNERTYPQLIALLDELQVPSTRTEMSFSVQAPLAGGSLEWSGSDLGAVFAQRRNLLRPRFIGMLADVMRFNRLATRLATQGAESALTQSLGEFLDQNRFGGAFRRWYLLPMLGSIWSCPADQMLHFPVGTMIRFCHNHGLIQVTGRPAWRTVTGGARSYVERIVAGLPDCRLSTPVRSVLRDQDGVRVLTDVGWERFDHVVLATHSQTSLGLLGDAVEDERSVLSAVGWQANIAVLHTDERVLPRARRAWAAWNYEQGRGDKAGVCVHYLLNRLQPLPWAQPVLVSLNPVSGIDPARVLGEYRYEHPVFDAAAIRAQAQLPGLQGRRRTWYAGAWTGYGFHEDGLKSGQAAARRLLALPGLTKAATSLGAAVM